MKYIVRFFKYNEESVYGQYEFEHLLYMPRIGEEIIIHDKSYIVTSISSNFDTIINNQLLIDYIIREVY